ncbi:NPP1 family protein [Streptomyces koelreuteriae]|uniref:NPP1 family protein n=1 Tax=Streptomyces koelreuteriae TaxID=2838015 RepID=UPI003EBD69F7
MSRSKTMNGRAKARLGRLALVAGSVAALTLTQAGSASAAILTPLPPNASTFQTKYKPFFDYDSDSCFPAAAIDNNGTLNGGLNNSGSITGGCRTNHLGKANTYAQSLCKNGWCAYVYTLYFEKDQCDPTSITDCGHRHDWESVVVFQKQGEERPRFLSASRHGGYSTHPINEVPMDGNNVKIVYHKDGASTHAFRFAQWGETAEAWGDGGWDKPGLLTLDNMRSDLRTKLSNASWGNANFPLAGALVGNINKARGADSRAVAAMPAF